MVTILDFYKQNVPRGDMKVKEDIWSGSDLPDVILTAESGKDIIVNEIYLYLRSVTGSASDFFTFVTDSSVDITYPDVSGELVTEKFESLNELMGRLDPDSLTIVPDENDFFQIKGKLILEAPAILKGDATVDKVTVTKTLITTMAADCIAVWCIKGWEINQEDY